ncbi:MULTISPECIES: hypothetical protein [unclassified Streptomyces]|uniref:hypothetical protein n=1 Tax=unclassified Streptomyces TaxID=2593676 RepID=UPI00202487B2|nr:MULTISPECIES: hypothetical protein [unclassified Streptomyces]WSQ69680.1 hypothetical protein OG393_33985 [Streptomyces sp. NBC_01216]
MRAEISFDLGINDGEVEYEADFTWETGSLPLPRKGDRVALGELMTIVQSVTFSCQDTGYIATRDHAIDDVEVHLALRLGKRERKARYQPAEFYTILSQLPSVSGLHVTGADQ